MHALNKHLTQNLTERLQNRRIVTWYDPRNEFQGFVAELAGGSVPDACRLDEVNIGDTAAKLCVLQQSFFEVKFAVEPLIESGRPDPLLIYIAGRNRDDQTAVLMELEAGGDRWEPQLKREARRVLKKYYGDGRIDQLLESDSITYDDIVGLLETSAGGGGSGDGALLDVILKDAKGNNTDILADWLADDTHDGQISEKGAESELQQLIASRLGLDLTEAKTLADARLRTARYVLIGEFRNDLDGDAPGALEMVPRPGTKAQTDTLLSVAKAVRQRHPDSYTELADRIEGEFNLAAQGIDPSRLGGIDTFRFEERRLLEYCGQLILDGRFDDARDLVQHRRDSFWARHQLQRQEQWAASELATELGAAVAKIGKELPDDNRTAVHWVEGYTAEDGWYRADLLHRRFESTLSAMTEPVESELVVHRVRQDYDNLLERMTQGFVGAFSRSDWAIPGVLHQSHIYEEEVCSTNDAVCYVLVDALRYEMGVELLGLLEGADELSLQPAIGAIPTITPIGMAALMPDAEKSFSVVEHKKELGAKIQTSQSGSMKERRKIWSGSVPGIVDVELDKVLSESKSKLQKRIADAPLLLVRSTEIDAVGEGGNTALARQVLDTAINNVAKAIKRLAALGISRFVVVADHGHLFALERDESQRIDKPGGDTVSMHRRCWAGRGGANPPGTIRITSAQLGYDSDLDFVFPNGNSVFKAGGDLTYYHGGLSMQELVVPVLNVRMTAPKVDAAPDVKVSLSKVPAQIANRVVTFGFSVGQNLFSSDEVCVRPVLQSSGRHVGHAGMALDATFDPETHCVSINPGSSCSVGIQLLRDDVDFVEIVILDPGTDSVLAKSEKIPVRLGM